MYAKSFYIYQVDEKTALDFNKKGFVEKTLEAQFDIPKHLENKTNNNRWIPVDLFYLYQ